MVNLRTPLIFTSPVAGGTPDLRTPLLVGQPVAGGVPALRAPLLAAQPVAGGVPALRTPLMVAQPVAGGVPNVRCPMMTVYAVVPEPLDVDPQGPAMPPMFPHLLHEPQWDRKKSPLFNTAVRETASGPRTGTAFMPEVRWNFEFSYDWLPNPSYLETLAGFFKDMYGRAYTFLYQDPEDYHVVGGQIAVGDDVTYHWPLAASIMGGPVVPIWWVDTSTLVSSFSSVSGNTFHAPGHGLTTGQGPVWISTLTVEYGLLPPPLEPGQPYWVIKVDNDHFQLADTLARAMSSTPVTLTGAGSLSWTLTKGIALYDNGTLISVEQWTFIPPNQIMFVCPPLGGHVITADFDYFFLCRFQDDLEQFSQFVDTLYELQKLGFDSERPPPWVPPPGGIPAQGILQEGWDAFTTSFTSADITRIMEADGWWFPPQVGANFTTPLFIQQPTRYGYGARLRMLQVGNATTMRAVKPTYRTDSSGFLSAAFFITTGTPTTTWPMLVFYDAINQVDAVSVRFETGGVISVYSGNTRLGASAGGMWNYSEDFDVEAYAVISATAGEVEVRVQRMVIGVPPTPITVAVHLTNVNTQPGQPYFDAVGLGWSTSNGGGISSVDFSIDDLRHYYAPKHGFLGICRVQTLLTNADGGVLDWTRSNTGLPSWNNIQNEEVDDTLYLYDSNVSDYTLALIGPLLNTRVIYWIGVKGAYRQDDATQRFVKNRVWSCGFIRDGSVFPPPQSYSSVLDILMTDPHTSQPFTGKAVSALQVGPYVYA